LSNALPYWHYMNPEKVLERKQESQSKRSCAGCAFEDEITIAGKPEKYCLHGKRHGRKCETFIPKEIK